PGRAGPAGRGPPRPRSGGGRHRSAGVSGREVEMAEILRFIRDNDIRNVVWDTADVHYSASHFYEPRSAAFPDFAPFWEFVSGPLNAGTFGPNRPDGTFGPQVRWKGIPDDQTA